MCSPRVWWKDGALPQAKSYHSGVLVWGRKLSVTNSGRVDQWRGREVSANACLGDRTRKLLGGGSPCGSLHLARGVVPWCSLWEPPAVVLVENAKSA